MKRFAVACETVAATSKKLEKTAIVADYLKSLPPAEAAVTAVFFSGRPFPAWEEATLQVGGRSLWRIVAELAAKPDADLELAYKRFGDLGAVAGEVLPEKTGDNLNVIAIERSLRAIVNAQSPAAKVAQVRDLLTRVSPLEAKYIIKIITGDLRIGLKESLVEEAIAKAYGSSLAEVQRANMFLGDIGETLLSAAEGKLSAVKMRLFHPLGFMLASPVESAEEALSYFSDAEIEDKYDGIRAQAHVSAGEVKIFSRTRDQITESFPELLSVLASLPRDAILDGEIVAWEYPDRPEAASRIVDEAASASSEEKAASVGRARPFSTLQQRLGRKKVSQKMLRDNPVAFLAFDVLYSGDQLTIDLPLRERARILDELLSAPRRPTQSVTTAGTSQAQFVFDENLPASRANIIRAPALRAPSPEHLEDLFTAAQARGNEGLMIKDLNSTYTPGKRGKTWLKMKRELATLDVVVTAVEYGHGKRIGVLSDYTFAVWDGGRLVNIGKAYSGLTDAEISEMTKWFLDHVIPRHTAEDQGFRLLVEPKIVLEVAFNNMMRSDRHESGYALRFPRIVRLRPDKSPDDADTIERVKEIYDRQLK